MDKNSITGLLLIGAILIGFSVYNSPSDEEVAKFEARKDSIAQVEMQRESQQVLEEKEHISQSVVEETAAVPGSVKAIALAKEDSLKSVELTDKFGRFSASAEQENKYIILENSKIKAKISANGGKIVSVELKEYKTHDQQTLYLFDEDSSQFEINFYDNNRFLSSKDFYFEPQSTDLNAVNDDESLSMRLYGSSKDEYIEFVYSLAPDAYMVDYKVNFIGLDDLVRANPDIEANWVINAPSKEKSIKNERMTTTVFWKTMDDAVDYLSEGSDDEEDLIEKFQWVSFKQQYFSAVLICEDGFSKDNASIFIETAENSKKYSKKMGLSFILPFEKGVSSTKKMTFFFGPNNYQTLQSYGLEMQEMINLGWPVIRHVSKWVIIPMFNFLDSFGLSYGIIILILTIVIKMALFPLTYKNYMSSAKMKVLKPEIEEINKKYEGKDAMAKQQAVMALYKKAGVNPMAGCIPMALQMPILYAMFRFFPASIELRQQAFLWADDLSSYDSIYNLGFEIPFYGDHISGFTILMSISTFFYTKTNSSMNTMSGPQASQMKIMMYMMPFMLLFFFNNYAAGLSYYYFLANMMTMGQQVVIKKWFVNEDKIHAQIQKNKQKPVKKSNFQKRLEDMAKKKGIKPKK